MARRNTQTTRPRLLGEACQGLEATGSSRISFDLSKIPGRGETLSHRNGFGNRCHYLQPCCGNECLLQEDSSSDRFTDELLDPRRYHLSGERICDE